MHEISVTHENGVIFTLKSLSLETEYITKIEVAHKINISLQRLKVLLFQFKWLNCSGSLSVNAYYTLDTPIPDIFQEKSFL